MTYSRILFTFNIYVKLTICNIRNGAIRCQTADFLCDDNSNVCHISHHLQDICKNSKMPKVLTWKIKVRVK